MQIFLQASAGLLLSRIADTITNFSRLAISITIGAVIALLFIRWLMDAIQTSPFGRIAYYLRRPTDNLVRNARESRFYYPLREALKFNPAILMVLIGLAIIWYVVLQVIGDFTTIITWLGISLDDLGAGRIFDGVWRLIGLILLTAIFFLMTLMTLVFVNWISGLFERAAYWSLNRISPLLRVFEFGGVFAGWSFLILWIALYFAKVAVLTVFFYSVSRIGIQG
ncbi:MAG: hypothetical protein AB7P14_28625 [Blastocatellales bacterium]